MNCVVKFERDSFSDDIGTQEAKINFLQAFPRIANFKKNSTVFYCSGIYQLENGPPILILPWFMREMDEYREWKIDDRALPHFMDILREIVTFKDSIIDLKASVEEFSALDVIVYSYLSKVGSHVRRLVTSNFHEDVTEVGNVIKGKWDVSRDLAFSNRPVSFTCTYGTVGKNNPFLVFSKSFAHYLLNHVKSSKCLALIDEIFRELKDVDIYTIDRKIVEDARAWVFSSKNEADLSGTIDFAESLILENNICSKNAGMSYKFPMDKFFENLMENFLKMDKFSEVYGQSREEILGGAKWKKSDSENALEANANYTSIPDIVTHKDKKIFIFECKYKPFRIKYVNDNVPDPSLVSFGRDDRNQILSFIMSIRPSSELINKEIELCVLFPCNTVDDFELTELVFDSAILNIDSFVKNLSQSRRKVGEHGALKIVFLGINISKVLSSVISNNIQTINDFHMALSKNENILSFQNRKEKFSDVIDRRIELASLVIDGLQTDASLGRVKMAKLLYLAEAHLKLPLNGSYQREAAGPLDQRLLYHEKIGIESVGERLSYFKASRNSSNKGIKYVKGVNFDFGLKKAQKKFYNRMHDIEWLIKTLSSLNTEQSEIVATLYACWNDLLFANKNAQDQEIISDFYLWHESKIRFSKDRLLKALEWMRKVGLIPDGNGPLTSSKVQKVPFNF